MTLDEMAQTARLLVGDGRGLLAIDESTPTCNARFAKVGIAQSELLRCRYRDMLISTPGLAASVSGVILYDETIRQHGPDGTPLVKLVSHAGMIPGIKVDTGAKDLAGAKGEKVTEGLDGLRVRLAAYVAMGARFAKWRAVIALGDGLPSRACLQANAHALARYAALCQEAGLVPVVESEVLMQGDHSRQACAAATEASLGVLFEQLAVQRVTLEAMILKPNMVAAGLNSPDANDVPAVAAGTLVALRRVVPAAVAGIAFLSGGQAGPLASARLNQMNILAQRPGAGVPWPLAFSFARALQMPALQIWAGDDANREPAQSALRDRAACNAAAMRGSYSAAMERAGGG